MKNNYILAAGLFFVSAMGFAQVQRVSLIETFTSSTCPPCKPGNEVLEGVLQADGNEENHVSVKYQMSWPGTGDPYYTTEGNSRRTYYSVSGVPDSHIDGGAGFSPTGFTQDQLDAALAIDATVEIDGYFQVNEASQTVTVQVRVIAHEDLPGGTTLHCAIIEKHTTGNVKTNGETEFENVMKKMVPSTGGTILSGVDAGDTVNVDLEYTFNGSYVLPPNALDPVDHDTQHTVEEFDDLAVALWVQRITSKDVYQAAWAKQGTVSVEEGELEIASAKIYPNPATDNAAIAYTTTKESDVTINIINSLGEVVYTNTTANVPAGRTVEEVNTTDFANGLYIVNITTDTGKVTKKLNIQK